MLFSQKYWGKLNRKEWLVNGDRNLKYFQQRANARRKRKLVIKLKDACGVWIDNLKAIVDKFILDYSKRFKTISNTENFELICLLDMEEIKQALFSIELNKTPGPDGFGVRFFKHY